MENKATRILWSGLTGRIGREAIRAARDRDDVEIVSGICRSKMSGITAINDLSLEGIKWFQYQDLALSFSSLAKFQDIDVIVDFSHPQHLAEMVILAVVLNKPLIVGTSISSPIQLVDLMQYASAIPIFQSDTVSRQAKQLHDDYRASVENFEGSMQPYDGTDFAEVTFSAASHYPYIAQAVQATNHGEEIIRDIVATFDCKLSAKELYRRWPAPDVQRIMSPRENVIDDRDCRRALANDVLEIAKVMAKKSVEKDDRLYDLDRIWDELP